MALFEPIAPPRSAFGYLRNLRLEYQADHSFFYTESRAHIKNRPMPQTAEENVTEVHFDPDCPVEQMTHVLSSLDRWRGRTGRHAAQVRGNDRHDYRTTVIIEPSGSPVPDEAVVRQVFHVPTRNVSKAGLGFVAPPIFVARQTTGASPLVRTESIFQVGAKIKVKLGPADGKMPILRAEITRLRPVCFGFFDVGVRFVSREP